MALVPDAMRRAGPEAETRDAVRRELCATRDRDSVLGRYSIDRFGDTTLATYGALSIRHGRLVADRVLRP
jgi:branched-chain amino acid transport system substrate-binding protein